LESELMGEVTARANALRLLETKVTKNANDITITSTDLTELESELQGEVTARANALRLLETKVTRNAGGVTANSSAITALKSSLDGVTASALQTLETRVTRTENLDGSTNVAALARWLVKLTVGQLTGGIGLVNDGGRVKFYVRADRFALIPTGSSDIGERLPFFVSGGIPYLNNAIIRARDITADKIRAGTLTATEIANSAGLIRSQRIVETIQYANGASVLDWDYEVTRLTGVSIVHPQIVFNVTKIRIKNSESGALTPGSVQTGHIALGATAEVTKAIFNGSRQVSSSGTLVGITGTINGGSGYKYLVSAAVHGNKANRYELRRGSSVIATAPARPGSGDNNAAKFFAADGEHSTSAAFSLYAFEAVSGTTHVYSSMISVTIAKR